MLPSCVNHNMLGCQRWQSRVADFFCYFWPVSQIEYFCLEVCQVHFNMGASAMPKRQPNSVPESML